MEIVTDNQKDLLDTSNSPKSIENVIFDILSQQLSACKSLHMHHLKRACKHCVVVSQIVIEKFQLSGIATPRSASRTSNLGRQQGTWAASAECVVGVPELRGTSEVATAGGLTGR